MLIVCNQQSSLVVSKLEKINIFTRVRMCLLRIKYCNHICWVIFTCIVFVLAKNNTISCYVVFVSFFLSRCDKSCRVKQKHESPPLQTIYTYTHIANKQINDTISNQIMS